MRSRRFLQGQGWWTNDLRDVSGTTALMGVFNEGEDQGKRENPSPPSRKAGLCSLHCKS